MRVPELTSSTVLRASALSTAFALLVSLVVLTPQLPAAADTAPAPSVAATVSTDPLPTPQINGVVWDQVIVGDTVFVAGDFSRARPYGSPAGVNEVSRTYLLSYNLTTGELLPWAPTLNAFARAMAVSPDGSRLYVGGDFTAVNGEPRNRIVAFDTRTGSVVGSFAASANYRVHAVAATDAVVYFAGPFTSARGVTRYGAAAATAASGQTTDWAPVLEGGRAYGLAISPDGTKVVIGGDFTSLNGSNNPGYGLGMVDGTSGTSITPFATNATVRNAGLNAAIYSLDSDGESFYGSGYVYGSGGNLEGVFRANWSDGALSWVEDCHGDTYSVATSGDTVYAAGHPHYCGNIDGFPQTDPWTFYRGLAFSKQATGTVTNDPYGYFNFAGNSAPSLLNFFPNMNIGSYTGQEQGPWDVQADDRYTVFGGEFTTVNGRPQQGLVRFAVNTIAPNDDGPRLTGDNFVPSMTSPEPGTVVLNWPANHDRDNETLTYHVIRDGRSGSPVHVTTQNSRFYDRPTMTYVDTGLTPGQTYTYRLRAIDPFGNSGWGSTVSVTVATSGTLSEYAEQVIADKPTNYWRLGDTAGSPTARDSVSRDNGLVRSDVALGASGAIGGDSDTAARFTGSSSSYIAEATRVWRDQSLSVEAWFMTDTRLGGKIVGFGSSQSGNSGSYDRHVYMDTSGRLNFGVYNGVRQVLTSSKTYNDNVWHHVVASLGPNGMELHVDGVRVAANPDVTWGQNYWGYWRIGGDTTWSGARYFAGSIDEVAVYPQTLDSARVKAHYAASGRPVASPPPPADAYGAAVHASNPQLYWRLGETTGAGAADSGPQGIPGSFSGTYERDVPGALAGTGDRAARVSAGVVASTVQLPNPSTYSTEIWFSTTSTRGGKITGFGSSATGGSVNFGRHVIMQIDGTLLFGTGSSTIATTGRYNDGAWHHVVATQNRSGLRLYVDGALAASSSATPSQTYSGYWRAGGDSTGIPLVSSWFEGDIDEFAVYQSALSPATVSEHYQVGLANLAPVAAFTDSASDKTVDFDGSESADPDGTISDYAWSFGDGQTGSGATVRHEYATAGSYEVTLTVTDNRGATASETRAVTVTEPNQDPTAAFTHVVTDDTVAFDGSGSADPDGTVVEYHWTFGDGDTGTGARPTHRYAAAGEYTVTLTVTDDRGATDTASSTVTALAPPAVTVLARDTFQRSESSGWGTAETGGAWTTSPASATSVGAGVGTLSHGTAGSTRRGTLSSVSSDDVTVSADVTVDKPATGGGAYAGVIARQVGTDYYQARLRYFADGTVAIQLLQGGGTVLQNATLPGLTVSPGDTLTVKAQAYGGSPTTIRAKAWRTGTAEPTDWAATATSSAAALQTAGAVGVVSYLSGSATNTPVRIGYDNFSAVAGHADTPEPEPEPGNTAPTAAFRWSADNLTASFDAGDSSDPDGSIAAHAWDFGDGRSSTEAGPSHSYAAAGTYTVTLTVTDDDGATGSTSETVTVTSPPPPDDPAGEDVIAADDFERAVTGGWGTAPTGGDWSSATSASYSVAGGKGAFSHAAGSTRRALLAGISVADIDATVKVSADKAPASGHIVIGLVGRQVGNSFYQARVRLQPGGTVGLQILSGGSTVLASTSIAGVTFAAGDELHLRLRITGTSPTTLTARVWPVAVPEPTQWHLSVTDATAALQGPGAVGVESYISASAPNAPILVRFDEYAVREPR